MTDQQSYELFFYFLIAEIVLIFISIFFFLINFIFVDNLFDVLCLISLFLFLVLLTINGIFFSNV